MATNIGLTHCAASTATGICKPRARAGTYGLNRMLFTIPSVIPSKDGIHAIVETQNENCFAKEFAGLILIPSEIKFAELPVDPALRRDDDDFRWVLSGFTC